MSARLNKGRSRQTKTTLLSKGRSRQTKFRQSLAINACEVRTLQNTIGHDGPICADMLGNPGGRAGMVGGEILRQFVYRFETIDRPI